MLSSHFSNIRLSPHKPLRFSLAERLKPTMPIRQIQRLPNAILSQDQTYSQEHTFCTTFYCFHTMVSSEPFDESTMNIDDVIQNVTQSSNIQSITNKDTWVQQILSIQSQSFKEKHIFILNIGDVFFHSSNSTWIELIESYRQAGAKTVSYRFINFQDISSALED